MLPIADLTATALVAGLLFVALHYIPWSCIWGRPVKPPWTYLWGVVGLGGCYTLLLIYWQADGRLYRPWVYLFAWSLVVACGGGAVIGCYAFDAATERWACVKDEKAREEVRGGWGNERKEGPVE